MSATPGPWDCCDGPTGYQHRVYGAGDVVCDVVATKDAALIAAAPELLFALRALLRRAKDELADPADVHEVAIAEDVVARATGETK